MKKKTIGLFILFFTTKSFAQDFDLGSWNILNLKYTVNDKLSVYGEAQLRSLKFYSNFHYYEYKGGINYKFHKNATFSLGTGSHQTYKEGGDFVLPKNSNEFRTWPQISIKQPLWKLEIDQRYRAEFRFTNRGYYNRFRYRLELSYPFGKEVEEYKPYQISFSNELFFTNNEPYFERNRVLFAFDYKPSKATVIQIGYLHQFDYKIEDETGIDFLQIGLYIDLFSKKLTNKNPGFDLKNN